MGLEQSETPVDSAEEQDTNEFVEAQATRIAREAKEAAYEMLSPELKAAVEDLTNLSAGRIQTLDITTEQGVFTLNYSGGDIRVNGGSLGNKTLTLKPEAIQISPQGEKGILRLGSPDLDYGIIERSDKREFREAA